MGVRVIGLDAVRATVHAALVAALEPAGLPAYCVHLFPPDELAVPAAWIVSPFGIRPSDPRTVVAEVSVILVVDGAEPAQLAALDVLEGSAWVALETVGTATLAVATAFAAGGPTLHAVTITADVDVDVRTLCPPTLATSSRAH
jgi:hypothetical protein